MENTENAVYIKEEIIEENFITANEKSNSENEIESSGYDSFDTDVSKFVKTEMHFDLTPNCTSEKIDNGINTCDNSFKTEGLSNEKLTYKDCPEVKSQDSDCLSDEIMIDEDYKDILTKECDANSFPYSSEVEFGSVDESVDNHEDDKEQLKTCGVCGKQFAKRHALRQHLNIHAEPEVLSCNECGKQYLKKRSLRDHLLIHFDPLEYKCKKCGIQFLTKRGLKRHTTIHVNPSLLSCTECGKTFSRKWNLNQHMLLHFNPEVLKCHQCGKQYAEKGSLKEHLLVHSDPDDLKCKKCHKVFIQKRSLIRHMLIHTNPELLKCKECGKIFSRLWDLKQHTMIHYDPELFKCKKCGKKYAKWLSLKEHLLSHKSNKCSETEVTPVKVAKISDKISIFQPPPSDELILST